MSHLFQLSDEQYAKLAAYAAQHKQTPETLFQAWLSEVTQEEDILNGPLFQVAGMFAIGEPGWSDRHDEYLAEEYNRKQKEKIMPINHR